MCFNSEPDLFTVLSNSISIQYRLKILEMGFGVIRYMALGLLADRFLWKDNGGFNL